MFAPERHQQILQMLEEHGTVRTMDLAEKFQVTDETIRRDLQILGDNLQLTRVHGGASFLNGRPRLQSFTERRGLNVEKKEAIAQAALKWIQPDRTYAFDSSTTATTLVSKIPDLPYRVVTNSYAVMEYLMRLNQVELIATGGLYHPKTQTFVGGDSINTLRRHHIHTAFISCIGLDSMRGASEGFEQQATFKERLIQFSDEVVLLIDSTKFSQRSEYFFAELERISTVITDKDADPEFIEEIRSHHVEVLMAS